MEERALRQRTRKSAVGSLRTVRQRLDAMIDATAADEVIVVAQIQDHAARLRSFEIAAQAFREIDEARSTAVSSRA